MYETLNIHRVAYLLCMDEYASWTHQQATAIAEYYEELENEIEEGIEFDQVAIRCEWAGYNSACKAAEEYSVKFEDEVAAIEWLREQTVVIECKDKAIVLQQF